MIFRLLGQLVCRFWPLILLGWGALLLSSWLAAPSGEEFAQDKEFSFLPENAPSRRAAQVYATAFPDEQSASNIVLVLHRAASDAAQRERDLAFIENVLEPGLRQIAAAEGGLAGRAAPSDEPLFVDEEAPAAPAQQRSVISRIRTPNAPGTGALLISPDGRALLVVLELTTDHGSSRNWLTIAKVEALIRDHEREGKMPPGLEVEVTGSAVIGRDRTQAQHQGARATERLTLVLVVVLLLLIYRAPLPALIPLASVYLAVEISLSILALLARAGFLTLFQGIQIYITVLAYGAGVDYCLFLTARYKEELEHGSNPADALAKAVAGVGAPLVASAATVICGIAMMMFAEFGKFREAGFAIPLSLVLVLLATLTFSPALLRAAGRWAFWPGQPGSHGRHAPQDTAVRASIPDSSSATPAAGRLQGVWSRVASLLVQRPALIWLATVGLMAPFAAFALLMYNRLSYDLIGDLPASAPSAVGTRALQEHFPAGMVGPVTVLLVHPRVDFASSEGRDIVQQLTERLRERKEELGVADLRTLTSPVGIGRSASETPAGYEVSEETRREAARRLALERYTTAVGGRARIGTRLDVVLTHGPFAPESVASLDRLEQGVIESFPVDLQHDAQVHVIGTTASVRDLGAVMRRDRVRIELLVLAAVFLILILLLRRLAIPVYLLLSVLFSYYATLGVAYLVFSLLDPEFTGIDWKVAIFLFTILIAVGEDYNIFLLTRVREEQEKKGPIRGITEALIRTGPIISSCGIIMAGTFASLLAGSLSEMKQLGFALAFGVLLDTFVVRPLLVPAFLILQLGRGARNRLRTDSLSPS
jgi:RND superfamily putative drug exporter